MKVYVPIMIAHGTIVYEVPDDAKPHEIRDLVKQASPESISIDNIKPNLDALRLTPEIERNYIAETD